MQGILFTLLASAALLGLLAAAGRKPKSSTPADSALFNLVDAFGRTRDLTIFYSPVQSDEWHALAEAGGPFTIPGFDAEVGEAGAIYAADRNRFYVPMPAPDTFVTSPGLDAEFAIYAMNESFADYEDATGERLLAVSDLPALDAGGAPLDPTRIVHGIPLGSVDAFFDLSQDRFVAIEWTPEGAAGIVEAPEAAQAFLGWLSENPQPLGA